MSIELPNGKISLTLPEQVGHNARQISKIFQLLDGLNVQDNVVVVDDISHVLTAQEITVLQQAVAFIVYDGHLYIKSGESGSNAYFDIVFSITPPGTAITFTSSRITANLSNGALAIVNSSVSAYSTTQIDSLLSAKANITYVDSNFAALSGADFTGAITAPGITETMTGYSFTKYAGFDTYGTSETVYAGAVKTGNKLTLVFAYKFTPNENATGSAYTGRFIIPAAIMAKIYPAFSSIVDSRTVDAVISNYSREQVVCYVIKQDSTSLYFGINEMQNLTQGQTYYIRHEITLLLSDSLAS